MIIKNYFKIIILIIFILFINVNKTQITINSLDGYSELQAINLVPIGTSKSDSNSQVCKFNFGYSAFDSTGGILNYTVSPNSSVETSLVQQSSSLFVQSVLTTSVSSSLVIISTFTSSNGISASNTLNLNCLASSLVFMFGGYVNSEQPLKYDPFLNAYSGYVYFNAATAITPPATIESSSIISPKSQIVYSYSKFDGATSYLYFYRVSFIGLKYSDGSNWVMSYNLHNFTGTLSFKPPLNEGVVKSITTKNPTKYGSKMNSYFAYPQIISTVDSASSIYFPRVAFSTEDTSFNYAIPIPISGTFSPNSIKYMVASRSRITVLSSYNYYLPTPSTIYNSEWNNSDFSSYYRSNSYLNSYYNPINMANGNNITVSAFIGLVSSNKIAEHLGKFKLNNLNYFQSTIGFPFGYSSGNLSLWSIDIPILKHENSKVSYEILLDNGYSASLEYPQNQIVNSIINVSNIEFIAMNELNSFLVKINYHSTYGISNVKIMLQPNNYCVRYYTFGQMNITNGDIYNGQIQFYFENFDTQDNLNYETFNLYLYDMVGFEAHLVEGNYYLDTITQTIKLFNIPAFTKIDLMASDITSTLWDFNGQVSVTNPSINNLNVFIHNLNAPLILTINPQLNPIKYYGVYINNEKYVFSNVVIPGGIVGGNLPFKYTLSTSKSNTIYSSDGSLIEFNTTGNGFDLKGPIISKISQINSNGLFGYSLTIEDEINGFEYGYLVLMGSIDGSIYNFSLSSSTWESPSTKYSARFEITVSRECLFTQNYFISQLYLVDSQGINSTFFNPTYYDYYQHTHPWSESTTSILDSIDVIQVVCPPNTNSYQTPSINNLTVSKSFIDVFSDDRLVSFDLYIDGDVLDQQLPTVYLTTGTNEILQCRTSLLASSNHYVCSLNIPFGFGYPLGICVNVFGIIGKNSQFVGYSSLSLLKKNITGFISVNSYYSSPIVTSISSSSSNSLSSTDSNSSSVSISSESLCSINIDCGNFDQGICENDKCVCKYPWIGDNCSQKIIIFPRPDKNETDPTTVIETNSTKETSESITAIINILEIREINIDGSELKRFRFSNWTLISSTNSNQYLYITKIQTTNNQYTNINVTIEWFEKETDIVFAKYPITLKPSSIKYTISLDKYSFQSNLNTLQLIMATKVSSNNINLCPIKEFESDNSNNNIQSQDYIKLSINQLSFEGRFIKRALVDNNPVLISNSLLANEQYNTNQLVAIAIPHFSSTCVIDPDFSIILDTKSKTSDHTCQSKSSKLSKTKIAGIVIGAVGFSIVIISSILYVYYKNNQKAKLHHKIKNIQLNEKS